MCMPGDDCTTCYIADHCADLEPDCVNLNLTTLWVVTQYTPPGPQIKYYSTYVDAFNAYHALVDADDPTEPGYTVPETVTLTEQTLHLKSTDSNYP